MSKEAVRTAQCEYIDTSRYGRLDEATIEGGYGVSVKITVVNMTGERCGYKDPYLGVIDVAATPTRHHDEQPGVIIRVTLDVHQRGGLGGAITQRSEIVNNIIANGKRSTFGRGERYELSIIYPDYVLEKGRVYRDKLTGIYFGIGNIQWIRYAECQSSPGGPDCSHLVAIEYVDDHRNGIYIAGAKKVDYISGRTTAQAGKSEGVYFHSKDQYGRMHVKRYSTAELCSEKENIALFTDFHAAEAFLKKSGSTGSTSKKVPPTGGTYSVSDRLKERLKRSDAQRQNESKGKTSGGQQQQQRDARSRYEKGSGGRNWLVILAELLESTITYVIRLTHAQGLGKWSGN